MCNISSTYISRPLFRLRVLHLHLYTYNCMVSVTKLATTIWA